MTRIDKIRAALLADLPGAAIEVEDESHLHAGHAGAATGRGHFKVRVISSAFEGVSLIACHRADHALVEALSESEIHALST